MTVILRTGCLLLLIGALLTLSPAAVASSHQVGVESFSYAGEGDVATPQEGLHLWQSEPHAFEAGIDTQNGPGSYDVCLLTRVPDREEPIELACSSATVDTDGETTVTIEFDAWPANLTGRQDVSVVVTDPNESVAEPVASETLVATILERDSDPDEDDLVNELEAAEGTNFFDANTDDDGLSDGQEVHAYGTDPTDSDTDSDGLLDSEEVNDYQTDPTVADTDGDGLTDDLEVNDHGTNPNRADTDGDGLDDAAEVNTYGTDPTTADTDGDRLSDAAEVDTHGTNPNRSDTDQDGLDDGEEINVYETDPLTSDTDSDGLDDAAEVSRYQTDPADPDTDDDGLDDGAEVETHETNPNRADTDGDGHSDGEEISAGTDPLRPESRPATIGSFVQSPEVIGAILLTAGLALLVVFVMARRVSAPSTVIHRLGVRSASGGSQNETDDESAKPIDPAVASSPIQTNRGRVLELLEANDGRMLQSDIVERTDWSKSKVSRVLSDMDEDGEIAKIDVGRGNLISLPEVAPPGSRPRSDRDEQ